MALLGPGGCKVVSDQQLAQIQAKGQRHGPDPVATLETGVRPYAKAHARPIAEVLKALGADNADFDALCRQYGFRQSSAFPCNFWVSVEGRVARVDTASRMGKAEIEVAGVGDGKVAVLMGPVLVGTGVRDGFPGVKYSDFDDQTRFAAFGQELNRQLVAQLKSFQPRPGGEVHVVGVFSGWSAPAGMVRVVPVSWQ
jgi:predicted lipoprotein